MLLSTQNTEFVVNRCGATCLNSEVLRGNEFRIRKEGGEPPGSVVANGLAGDIDLQWFQRRILRCGIEAVQVLGKRSIAVVDPYPDSLTKEAAADDEIQIAITINVNGGDSHTKTISV